MLAVIVVQVFSALDLLESGLRKINLGSGIISQKQLSAGLKETNIHQTCLARNDFAVKGPLKCEGEIQKWFVVLEVAGFLWTKSRQSVPLRLISVPQEGRSQAEGSVSGGKVVHRPSACFCGGHRGSLSRHHVDPSGRVTKHFLLGGQRQVVLRNGVCSLRLPGASKLKQWFGAVVLILVCTSGSLRNTPSGQAAPQTICIRSSEGSQRPQHMFKYARYSMFSQG